MGMVYPAVIVVLAVSVLVIPFVLPSMLMDCIGWMLRARPDDYEGWCYYGRMLARRGRYAEAVYAYEKALTLKPDYTEAWERLGDSLTVMGKLEAAMEAYNNAGTGGSRNSAA